MRWYDWPHGKGYWAVTRHDDLVAIHKDTETYSSETGATALEDLDADAIEARKSMIDTDPPRHTRLRGLVNRGFTPRAVAAYENLLRELTRAILDDALPRGEFDFIEHIAAPLPIQVLCRILGVPPDDNQLLIDWGDRDDRLDRPRPCRTSPTRIPSRDRYRLLPFRSPAAVELCDVRPRHRRDPARAEPRDDLVTKLVEAEIDGERLTSREFDVMFLLLVVAGNETTRQAIAHGMQALMEHPDEMRRLRDDPALMPTARRRDHPLGHARAPFPPHRDPRRRARAGGRSARATRSSSGTSRRTATSSCSTIPIASTSAAAPTST